MNVESAGLPNAAWINRMKSPSLLLLLGAELYVTFAVLAWTEVVGKVTCSLFLDL